MSFTKSAVPARLARRGVRADHRAGAAASLEDRLRVRRPARRRRLPLHRHAGPRRRRHVPRGRARPARRVRLGLGGRRRPAARRLDRDDHRRAGRRRLPGHPRPRGSHRRAGGEPRRGLEPLPRAARAGSPPPATPVRTSGPGRPRTSPRSSAADAALAVIQPVLRNLTAEDRPKPTPCADFTCHELAEHLLGSLAQLGAMAGADRGRPRRGLAREQDLRPGRAGDRRLARRRPRRHACPAPVAGDAGRVRRRASCRSSCSSTAGTSRRPAASSCTSPTRSWPTSQLAEAVVPGGRGAARSPTRSPRPPTPSAARAPRRLRRAHPVAA